jgi:dienelactone hydrolase
MYESAAHHPHPEEPAEAVLRPEPARAGPWADLNAQRFEVVSRGDFVPGILYLPASSASAPAPLLLLQHGSSDGSSEATSRNIAAGKASASLECAVGWVGKGLAVAMIDLPLHGERASAKLSERLVWGVGQLSEGLSLDAETRVLVEEFATQTTSDLIRTLDALCRLPEIDRDRVGFLGFGLGAMAGTYLLAHDPRARVAVFAQNEGEVGAPSALPGATLEPSKQLRIASGADGLAQSTVDEAWRFLSKELGL